MTFSQEVRTEVAAAKKRAGQRGAVQEYFLAGGSVSNPAKGYHAEFVTASPHELMKLLHNFDLHPKKTVRGGQYVVYIKEAEEIASLLQVLGATAALLKFEGVRVEKSVAGDVNRRVNCETANLGKTVTAGIAQSEAIHLLAQRGELAHLEPHLVEVAKLRLKHPDATLAEIGQMLNPPVGKSGINHRMRKIIEESERIAKA